MTRVKPRQVIQIDFTGISHHLPYVSSTRIYLVKAPGMTWTKVVECACTICRANDTEPCVAQVDSQGQTGTTCSHNLQIQFDLWQS